MAILGDPIADMLLERCEEHGWRNPLLPCPKCKEQRENTEKLLREQRELTRLVKERNERDDAAIRQRERDEEYARSIQARERWRDERSRQQQRWQEEEREQRKVKREEAEESARAEYRAAWQYELDRLESCPYCGQRYDGAICKRPGVGVNWAGLLGRYSAQGVCPRCYHERLEKGEEIPWTELDWKKYLSVNLTSDSNREDIAKIFHAIKSSNYPHLIETVRSRVIAKHHEDIENIKNEIMKIRNIHVFESRIVTIDQIRKDFLSITYDSSSKQDELDEFLREQRERIKREEVRQNHIKGIEEKYTKTRQEREAALNRFKRAEYELKSSKDELKKQKIVAIKDGFYSFLILGVLGSLGGSCYEYVNSNSNTTEATYYFGIICALTGFVLSVSYAYSYGNIRTTIPSVTRAELELEDAQLLWLKYESSGIVKKSASRSIIHSPQNISSPATSQRQQLLKISKIMGLIFIVLLILCVFVVLKGH